MSFGALEEIAVSSDSSEMARAAPATHAAADPRAGGLGEINSKGLVVPEAAVVRDLLSSALTAPLERASVRLFINAPDEAGALELVKECIESAARGNSESGASEEPKLDPSESEEAREARLQAYMKDVGAPLLQVCLLGAADAWQQGKLSKSSDRAAILDAVVACLDRVKERAASDGNGTCAAAQLEAADCVGRAQRDALAEARRSS